MLSPNALTVLERRYLQRNRDGNICETPGEMFRRVADHVASVEQIYNGDVQYWSKQYFDLMHSLTFLPNSPTLMNAGRVNGQLSACFVLPIEDTLHSIFETLKQAAIIQKSGGGTGFSFSRIRPAGDRVLSTMGSASGPLSFMTIYDVATEVVKQGSVRRGANMAVLRVDHPDIENFITIKRHRDKLNNFNLSVGITDSFMDAVEHGGSYNLINPRTQQVAGTVDARRMFDLLVQMAWENGEPGVLFLDRINANNPTPELGLIETSNPCGEQPLLPYESCNLGSINLAKILKQRKGSWVIDFDKLRDTVQIAVRFLDSVIDINSFPLEQIRRITLANRKIGLGVMGFADMLLYLGIPYDSADAVETAEQIMQVIQSESEVMSAQLAKERGPFPNFPQSVYARAGKAPLRNATTTTIAPTGTISIIAGCSSGIEPLYALAITRNVMERDILTDINPVFLELAQHYQFAPAVLNVVSRTGSVQGVADLPNELQRVFVTAHDIAPEWHIRVQGAFQKYTHNAVSKTINYSYNASVEDIKKGFFLAYQYGCKGVTVYRDGSRAEQVLTTGMGNAHCDMVHNEGCE